MLKFINICYHWLFGKLNIFGNLAAENIALRQQLIVLKRNNKRPTLREHDRLFWVLLSRIGTGWRDVVYIVQPDTVVRWHKTAFKFYWRRKSECGKRGRPSIDPEIRAIVLKMVDENPLWGAPTIHGELLTLGPGFLEQRGETRMPSNRSVPWICFLYSLAALCLSVAAFAEDTSGPGRPNILLAISDDQSWPHAGAYGDTSVQTPAFDRVASAGVLFTHAFCPASQCSPSRASLLTGRNIWQLEEAGTHASLFPAKFDVYTELLEQAGYHVGYTGKPWGPGNWEESGRKKNPAGAAYNKRLLKPPTSEISSCDYSANFAEFLEDRPPKAPFCFWYGGREPHRNYEQGSAIEAGKSINDAPFPPFYPDHEIVRGDLADYRLEIEWFDRHLGQMLQELERRGELENTLVVVTSDNGMPFPRAKATLYESGTRVPLAVQWPARFPGGRVMNGLVSLIDLAPTFLEAAGLQTRPGMAGRSLLQFLSLDASDWAGPARDWVVLGKERHNHARADNLGYPTRALRTKRHLYIRNLKPDRWPMGDPPGYYCHTKMYNPTKDYILDNKDRPGVRKFYAITYAKRPAEELYDVKADPDCLRNLASESAHAAVLAQLRTRLDLILREQGDPRMLGYGDVFESYPYFGRMQLDLGGFAEVGRYNPRYSSPPDQGNEER